ncbi:MAG TPA: LuxR C-terminal-related transcriptional regulator [Candidatus Limnocylindria bacterium]|nr:LuxR C-terminal-related transcriptional regulator [Candidatus Limnocylindria bacterium]
MARTLVETKLYAPHPRHVLVERTRLADRLNDAERARLVLVSAPTGFGKSTLLAAWAERRAAAGDAIAWVSLEPSDDDPTAFWTYVAAAIQRAVPAARAAATLLEDVEPPPVATVLAVLVNDLARVDADVTLVLDDFHVIQSSEVADQLAVLLERLPPRVRVAIATRADPAFPIGRLRAKGELVEVRAADLRFTTDETAAYLNEVMSLGLDAPDVTALEERTEGWIAALQLAALSMAGRDDPSAFIASFTGDDRFVVDYLIEEVLERQPDDVRAFLLETSILDRLTGDLCDALTGRSDGRNMLEALDRSNLFVVALDARREWYRYHHLFAELLRSRLNDERPSRGEGLHRRAAAWLEAHAERDAAIRHALAGRDWNRAADLLERAIPDLRRGRQELTLRRLLGALPPELMRTRPVLTIGYVGSLMSNGEIDDIDGLLADAERWLEADAPRSEMVVADEAELARLPSAIAMYRAAQSRIRGDDAASVEHAHRAHELAGPDDHLGRGGAAGFLALAAWTRGDLDEAHAHWTEAMASIERAGHLVDAIAIVRALAEIRAAQGRLRDARRTYERGLEAATTGRAVPLRGTADLHTGLAELALEANDLDGAAEHLRRSAELDDLGLGLPQNAARRRVVAALVRAAEGDPAAALNVLEEAEGVYLGEYFPIVRPIPALRARLWLLAGRPADAEDWAAACGLSVDTPVGYLREYELVTLARVLVARSARVGDAAPMRDAAMLLERVVTAADAGGRRRTAMECLVLLSIAGDQLGEKPRSLAALHRALDLAAPEGYVRPFVGEGEPMTALLKAAIAHGIRVPLARRLLAAAETPPKQPLPEPLSGRELEVLGLLATELSGPEIAERLVVGLSTVRSHTKRIYAKLDVNGRRAAVRRADELGLLPNATRR